MNINNKYLRVFLIFVLSAVLIYLIWLIFIPKPKVPTSEEQKQEEKKVIIIPEGGKKTDKGEGGEKGTEKNEDIIIKTPTLQKISDHEVLGYWYVSQLKEIKYISTDGTIWSANSIPNKNLSSQEISGVKNVFPSKDGSKTLISYQTEKNIAWLIYNSLDDTLDPLPQSIINATWGKNNDELIATIKENDNYNLVSIDLTKSIIIPKTLVKNFGFLDAELSFVPPNNLYILEKSSAFYESGVYLLDLKNNSFTKIISPEKGILAKISSNNSFIFYSEANSVNLLNLNSLENINLPVHGLANKCNSYYDASDTSTIFCFNSDNMDNKMSLPDEYFQKEIYSFDTLYKYNLKTKQLEPLLLEISPVLPRIDGVNIFTKGNEIYFINRIDSALYKLTIPS